MNKIAVFKNKEKKAGSNEPDARLVASWKDGDEWKSVTVASLWKGDGENPNGPALNGNMNEEYTNKEGKTYPAFEIKRVAVKVEEQAAVDPAAEQINPEDIPF